MLSLPELFTAGLISEETSTCHPTFFEFPASLHSSLRDISPSRNHSSFSIDFCDSVVHVMYALHSNQCFKNQNREKQVFIFNNSQRETKLIKNVSTTITSCHQSPHVFSRRVFFWKMQLIYEVCRRNCSRSSHLLDLNNYFQITPFLTQAFLYHFQITDPRYWCWIFSTKTKHWIFVSTLNSSWTRKYTRVF